MKKLGPKLEVSPATKRLWQELKQEMVSATRLFHNPSLYCLRGNATPSWCSHELPV